ncbi:uncharacterized protein BJ171DRAFT_425569 [Polychytrium aggregatum]|uniref:uncharacterized protein n=1 Tax=Polychytrium aggregatum TaxID=110093 RepID=UPI0022FE27C8|nr:uncharacterized protein BJ171DRAFT_425569 [Polychytrium aggregatum]KAI9203152.1 hypothetical protein BJ171DRAFT_425569 [Polychytrium aggregatum]
MRDQGKRHHKEQLESLRFREPNLSPQQTSPVLSPTNPRRVLRIANGRILRNHALITDDLWIEDGKIINPAPVFWDAKSKPHMVVDAHGAIISPGYIDLQINGEKSGAFGVDFSDADDLEKKLPALKKALLKSGCTGFCPTIVSTSPEQYRKLIPKLQPSAGSIRNGAANLGIHLEGPFISPKVAGAHPSDIVREAPGSWKDFATTYGFDRDDCERRRGNGDGEIAQRAVRMITCAPEVQGVMKTIPDLVRRGFVVSVGYTNSTTAEAEEAISSGASFVTHLFNGMQPFHHRDPGTIGLLGSTKPSKRPFYGIICDGLHSHPFSVRIAHNAHRDGIVLVTDAIPAAGMPPGKYKFSSTVTEKHKDAAYIEGSDALAGSVIMMDECVRNFKKFSRCTTVEALEAATLNPAQVLGIQKTKGTLDFGADADLLFLDDDLNVKRVFIAGKELV